MFIKKPKKKYCKYKGKRKQGDKIKGTITFIDKNGEKKQKKTSFRKHKSLPKGCKTPKQLCLNCFKKGVTTYISKRSVKYYDLKLCKECCQD